MCMTNLFAYRATDPKVMKAQQSPTGDPHNMTHMLRVAAIAEITVAAWGTHGSHMGRAEYVLRQFRESGLKLRHLGLNSDGSPKHPLYFKKDIHPLPWK